MRHKLIFFALALACISCGKGNDGYIDEGKRGTILNKKDGMHPEAGTHTIKKETIFEWLGEDGTKKVEYTTDLGKDYSSYETKQIEEQLKYDVDYYILPYITAYGLEGSKVHSPELVAARALVLVPKDVPEGELRLAAYFHGTVLPVPQITNIFDMGTPADFRGDNGSQDVRHCALPLASAGYCVICPEYTGYGPTSGRDHPFVYYPELWQSSYDSLVAGYEFLTDPTYGINASLTRDIYLTGWSQGGGMALYAQRDLESRRHYLGDFNVKGTSTIAGPFNVYRFLTEMLEHSHQAYLLMALYGWAGYAINMFCPTLQRPMDQIFRPSIYDQTDAFIQFGNTPDDLFQQFFAQNVLNGKDEVFINALKDDSTYEGWEPKAPVWLHHGAQDNVVPCFNSEDAYKGLKDSAQQGIHLYLYKDLDHTNFVPSYISRTIEEFSQVQ